MDSGIRKLKNCDVLLMLNGVRYSFENVLSIAPTRSRNKTLLRGINNPNSTKGIVVETGISSPDTFAFTLVGIAKEIADVLNKAFAEDTRLSLVISPRNEDSKGPLKISNAIITQFVDQSSYGEGDAETNVAITIAAFDIK
jgi:hypothetical protein